MKKNLLEVPTDFGGNIDDVIEEIIEKHVALSQLLAHHVLANADAIDALRKIKMMGDGSPLGIIIDEIIGEFPRLVDALRSTLDLYDAHSTLDARSCWPRK